MVLEGCSQDTRPAKTDGAANESTAEIAEAANETNNQQLATQQSGATKQPEISTTTEEPKQIIFVVVGLLLAIPTRREGRGPN